MGFKSSLHLERCQTVQQHLLLSSFFSLLPLLSLLPLYIRKGIRPSGRGGWLKCLNFRGSVGRWAAHYFLHVFRAPHHQISHSVCDWEIMVERVRTRAIWWRPTSMSWDFLYAGNLLFSFEKTLHGLQLTQSQTQAFCLLRSNTDLVLKNAFHNKGFFYVIGIFFVYIFQQFLQWYFIKSFQITQSMNSVNRQVV